MGQVSIGIDQARRVAIRSPKKIAVMIQRRNRSVADFEWDGYRAWIHTIPFFLVNDWAVVGHNLEDSYFGLSEL